MVTPEEKDKVIDLAALLILFPNDIVHSDIDNYNHTVREIIMKRQLQAIWKDIVSRALDAKLTMIANEFKK